MINKFYAFYMFIFDQKKVMNYIKSKTEFFQTAVQLGAGNFRKLFWESCALSGPGPYLSTETELFLAETYPNSKLIYNQRAIKQMQK